MTVMEHTTEGIPFRSAFKTLFFTFVFDTIIAIFLRVIVMTLVNYVTLQQPYPLGFELPEIQVIATLPLTAIFNATVVLYVIPIGEFIANVVKSRLKLEG